MGILTRFKDIMSANINAMLDKVEDPSKMIDEYLRKIREQLAEVKKETAEVMAEEKRTKRLVDANNEQIRKYEDLAKKALLAGNEDDAKVFIAKKQQYETNGADLSKAYTIALDNANKMKEMHDKLTSDLEDLERRRQNVKSKVAVAKTQEKLNSVANTMQNTSSSMKAFERMEAKADKMLDTANSMASLDEPKVDEATALEQKYAKMSPDIDDEISKLKKELNLE